MACRDDGHLELTASVQRHQIRPRDGLREGDMPMVWPRPRIRESSSPTDRPLTDGHRMRQCYGEVVVRTVMTAARGDAGHRRYVGMPVRSVIDPSHAGHPS